MTRARTESLPTKVRRYLYGYFDEEARWGIDAYLTSFERKPTDEVSPSEYAEEVYKAAMVTRANLTERQWRIIRLTFAKALEDTVNELHIFVEKPSVWNSIGDDKTLVFSRGIDLVLAAYKYSRVSRRKLPEGFNELVRSIDQLIQRELGRNLKELKGYEKETTYSRRKGGWGLFEGRKGWEGWGLFEGNKLSQNRNGVSYRVGLLNSLLYSGALRIFENYSRFYYVTRLPVPDKLKELADRLTYLYRHAIKNDLAAGYGEDIQKFISHVRNRNTGVLYGLLDLPYGRLLYGRIEKLAIAALRKI